MDLDVLGLFDRMIENKSLEEVKESQRGDIAQLS